MRFSFKSALTKMWTPILCIIFVPIFPLVRFWFYQEVSPPQKIENPPKLPRLNVDKIAISGFSSGGFFAQQMYLAHAELFSGMATLSGGPFLCAEATGHTRIFLSFRST